MTNATDCETDRTDLYPNLHKHKCSSHNLLNQDIGNFLFWLLRLFLVPTQQLQLRTKPFDSCDTIQDPNIFLEKNTSENHTNLKKS